MAVTREQMDMEDCRPLRAKASISPDALPPHLRCAAPPTATAGAEAEKEDGGDDLP